MLARARIGDYDATYGDDGVYGDGDDNANGGNGGDNPYIDGNSSTVVARQYQQSQSS